MSTERESSWVMRMNHNLKAIGTPSGIGGHVADATSTISPDFFRIPIPLRDVSKQSYIPEFCPLGLYSHATAMTGSSIHMKFREDFAKIFMDNTGRDWADICLNVVGHSVEDWVKLYGDFKLEQPGERGLADAPQLQNVTNVIGTGLSSLNNPEEIKILLVLDTVFVVCFIQGDHQRVCEKKNCPAVSSLNQEMKKEVMLPLVHLLRLDLFKFENQIPIGLIRNAVELIIFEPTPGTLQSSNDPFKKFLVDAVDVIYCLPGPRQRQEFKDVLHAKPLSNCKHLLECLYLVLCHTPTHIRDRGGAAGQGQVPQPVPPAHDQTSTSATQQENASWRRTGGGSSHQGIAPSGEATAQGDTVLHVGEIQPVQDSTNTARNALAGSVTGSEHGVSTRVSQEENASSRVTGGGATSNPAGGDGLATANTHENALQPTKFRWWPRVWSCLSKRRQMEHIQTLHNPTIELQRVTGGGATSNRAGADGLAAANAPGNASQPTEFSWWPCYWSCLCKRREKEHTLHIPTISELQKAGIKVTVGRGKFSTNWISEVNFKRHWFKVYGGTLYLPEFSVYDETETLLRNLLAYEYVVEKKKDLISYIHLMDNLINTEEDVKLMREGLVLKNNSLGSDELVADMWNRMLKGTVVDLNERYSEVFSQISSHYDDGWNKFFSEFHGLYLRRPWLFLGALLLLVTFVATILATVYTIWTYYDGSKQRQTT